MTKSNDPVTLLDKLRANDELRADLLDILRKMVAALDPDSARDSTRDPEQDPTLQRRADGYECLLFDTRLALVANTFLALEVDQNAARIQWFCSQEQEKNVKGLDPYPIYWLCLSKPGCPDPGGFMYLSLWVVGADMNQEENAIRIWKQQHFPEYHIESLRQVRRGKFVARKPEGTKDE